MPKTPPPPDAQSIDEFDNFDQLARNLVTVSKRELDAVEALRKAAKLGKITGPTD